MEGGSGGTPPENFGILHALKCVMGASEAPFCACIKYIHTCKLPSSFSGFRSKVRRMGPWLVDCAVVTYDKMCIEVFVLAA